MMLRLNSLVRILTAVILGNLDAVISHAVTPKVPIWFIDLYAIPIEYVIVNGLITTLTKVYKRIRNAR